jgi:5-methylcytosine-specific restriction enzyme A
MPADPFYTSASWRAIRKVVLKRDNHTCTKCGQSHNPPYTTTQLHVDHILPRKQYPNLALSLDNLRTLCLKCHSSEFTSFGRDARGLNKGPERKKVDYNGFPDDWQ